MASRVKIVTFVPPENADDVRKAMGDAGAGALGKYSHCSVSMSVTGRFTPDADADPHIGEPGVSQSVEEQRIEVICPREKAKEVIDAMIEAHPYEEVAYDVIALIEYDEL